MFIGSVFSANQPIPKKYTSQGADVSPPLNFGKIPPEAESLVLIVDDPDAPNGVFDHWIVWNISPNITVLSEGAPELRNSLLQVREGVNHYGKHSYNGPNPPSGQTHRYFFKLYALNTILDIPIDADKQTLEEAMNDYVIAKAELVGLFTS